MKISGSLIEDMPKKAGFFKDILFFDEIDSTNNQAQRLLATRNKYPFWIIADEQTAGRGRKNR